MIVETAKPFTPMTALAEPTLRLRGSGRPITQVNVVLYSREGAGTLLTSIKAPMPWVLHSMRHADDEYLVPLNDERDLCLVWWGVAAGHLPDVYDHRDEEIRRCIEAGPFRG